jgi:hypothetical protein
VKKTNRKWLGAALLALVGMAGTAGAATNPAYLNIDVAISGSKSVTVLGVGSSTDTSSTYSTPDFAQVAPSTVVVENNSGIITEQWELSTNANSLASAGSTWALVASTTNVPADSFALQAVFGSSTTASAGCSGASWTNGTIAPPLAVAVTAYTTTVLADSALNSGGANTYKPDNGNSMYAWSSGGNGVGQRALCWRLSEPLSTTASATQNVQLIVTAF